MSVYGYARVSTMEQCVDRQLVALEAAGVESANIYVDKLSGKDFNREAYQRLTGADGSAAILQEGDCLVLHSLDRLGRDYDGVRAEWQRITQTLKADIKVLDMPLLDTTKSGESLDKTFMADLVLQILSYVAERERLSLLARQSGGIQAARERGVYDKSNHKGKVRQAVNQKRFEQAYTRFVEGEISIKEAAGIVGLGEATLRRRFHERTAVGADYNPNAIPA